MKVVMAHTFYKQKGGEDESYRAEARLLEDHGHRVERFERHNSDLDQVTPAQAALKTIWNQECIRQLSRVVKASRPDVVHFQNTFPLISPAAYYAARRHGAAVIQALRNYRYSCVNGLLFREGQPCEQCAGSSIALAGVQHRCYRRSYVGSAVVATMQATHKLLRTYDRQVDTYIAVSEFVRRKYMEFGIDGDRIAVKPNFVYSDPAPSLEKQAYAVFVGRLSPEKGVQRLLETWQREGIKLELRIVGDGPERDVLRAQASGLSNVTFFGALSLEATYAQIAGASYVIVPSEWYEPFGRTAVEGLAHGTPVICSDIGGLSEIVDEGVTGFKFSAGNSVSLGQALLRAVDRIADRTLRTQAREAYEQRYSSFANHKILQQIYAQALQRRTQS